MNSGTRSLLSEVLTLAFMAVAAAMIVANWAEVRAFSMEVLGIEFPETAKLDRKQPQSSQAQKNDIKPVGYVELRSDGRGHFETAIEVNGRSVHAMVDTGATVVAMSHEDARRAGLMISDRDYTGKVHTANGVARVAPVTLSRVRVGDITIRNVRGIVSEPGRLSGTLLGMSFLSRLSRFEIRDGRLILQE